MLQLDPKVPNYAVKSTTNQSLIVTVNMANNIASFILIETPMKPLKELTKF